MDDHHLAVLRLAGQGYCCVQIPLMLVLEAHGRTNPGLASALFALCHGFPDGKGPCGALTGGACLLGYFAGKGAAATVPDERLPLMLEELSSWFTARYQPQFGGIGCGDIVPDGHPVPEICGGLIIETHIQTLSLLAANGFDPNEDPFGG